MYVKKNTKKIYFHVAFLLNDEKTIDREFRPLKLIDDNYPKYVLTMDKFLQSQNGIIHMNIIDFLRNFNHEDV